MLSGYQLTLDEANQIRNWKKKNNFNGKLLGIDEVSLSKIDLDLTIFYKKAIPLNLFEKYIIQLIERANEINAPMDKNRLAKLLSLDEYIVERNLESLEDIGFLHGSNSDYITINRDENAEYLQYENKFKIEPENKKIEVKKDELDNLEEYIEKEFASKDKKISEFQIEREKVTAKNVHYFQFTNNQFLIFSRNGINSTSDTKFISNTTFDDIRTYEEGYNSFCHKEEFLPILRDKLSQAKNQIIFIASELIEENNKKVFSALNLKENDLYFISQDVIKGFKKLNILMEEELILIGSKVFIIEQDNILLNENSTLKDSMIKKGIASLKDQILEIDKEFNIEKTDNLLEQIKEIAVSIGNKDKKELEKEITDLNTKKNKLYGVQGKNRRDKIKKIDQLYSDNGLEAVAEYKEFIKNLYKIKSIKNQVEKAEKQLKSLEPKNKELSKLNKLKNELFLSNEVEKYYKEIEILRSYL